MTHQTRQDCCLPGGIQGSSWKLIIFPFPFLSREWQGLVFPGVVQGMLGEKKKPKNRSGSHSNKDHGATQMPQSKFCLFSEGHNLGPIKLLAVVICHGLPGWRLQESCPRGVGQIGLQREADLQWATSLLIHDHWGPFLMKGNEQAVCQAPEFALSVVCAQ